MAIERQKSIKLICKLCGDQFFTTPQHAHARYCSDACGKKAQRKEIGDIIKKQKAEYYQKNKNALKKTMKRYWEKNKEDIKRQRKDYQKQYAKQKYQENREKILAKLRAITKAKKK